MAEVTCYVIIGHDTNLLRWCIENARARAGIPHEWLVVGWDIAEGPKKWCKEQGIRLVDWPGYPLRDFTDKTTWFLKNLYKAWNMGYEAAETPWVARLGSDQFFSRGWLKNLMDSAEHCAERACYHCWTVESLIAKRSRHDIQDWGSTWQEFDVVRFEQYASERAWRWQHQLVIPGEESGLFYHHPFRGPQQRCDGVTWLQTRKLWEEFQPMKDHINEEGVSGDVDWHDRMSDAGVRQYLVPSVTAWHMVRGESREIQK